MGQYYRPLMIFEDGKERSAYSHVFNNGLKLMEHSWIGNNFVNAVLHEIEDRPARVAWMGDYANDAVKDNCNFGDGYITSVESFLKKYKSVWGEYRSVQDIPSETPQYKLDTNCAGCYLVNATKQCYIDMEEYVAENSISGKYGEDGVWCVNPFPLLTCIGNGMGGGDYRGEVGMEDVGSWAFDKVYITYLRPGRYEKVCYRFQE